MSLGIVINIFGPNQVSQELLESINDENKKYRDISIFYEEKHGMPSAINCSMSYISNVWGYKGDIIATNYTSAAKIIKMPILGKRYYFIYNFEWLNHRVFSYEPLLSIISDKNLELICRTKEHAKLIKNNFNREVNLICDTLNVHNLMELIK